MPSICCACMEFIKVEIDDFGIDYVVCPKCGREYEIVTEFSQVSSEEDYDE